MTSIGAFEAKTHLSELLDRVARGEKIIITRHGVPVAMLAPVQAERKLSPEEILAGMKALRKKVKPGKMTIREMIAEGRRY